MEDFPSCLLTAVLQEKWLDVSFTLFLSLSKLQTTHLLHPRHSDQEEKASFQVKDLKQKMAFQLPLFSLVLAAFQAEGQH